MRRSWLVVLVGIGLMVVTAQPAAAHYVYEDVYVYASDADCTKVRSEISHGSGGGYSRTDVTAKYYYPIIGIQCYTEWSRPAGYIALRYTLLKWNGSSWAVCAGIGWYYNSVVAKKLTASYNYGTRPWCGSGYYGTMSDGYVYNGAWHGGSLWSGYHYLPA